ncbi:glycoside hydrolase family 10 protein [Thermomonospora umbrina]|uniref:glycoside hydrolase family 10 protein n=1 Tax=Thermomonospora umbrina TaxID=111806 RepID=UPI001FEA1306|nr:family 10 glycosylhydrolase [Thermomonospora umbrina]
MVASGLLAGCTSAAGGDGRRADAPVAGGVAECTKAEAPGDSRDRQTRAMWIATVAGIDWPGDPGHSVARKKSDYRKMLDRAKALGVNAVFVQVRPSADAFYKSPYEPWSRWISGRQGRDPGFDVLDFFVKEAHARDLEFHAWFNPYRVGRGTDRTQLHPDNPARRNPSWVRAYGDGLWYDPGIPQVRELTTKVVMDVVRRYDIDAVHFDDYFYPYPESGDFPDGATYKRYGGGKSKGDWRRGNVDTLVKGLSEQIHRAKPWVRFGISPFGVWRNKRTDPAGSATAALQSYDDIYADTRKWVKEGWVDYVTPQLYWEIGHRTADYRPLVEWWARLVKGTGVELTIGQASYRAGEAGAWRDPAELSRHLTLNERFPEIRGDVYFSAKDLIGDRGGSTSRLRRDHYATAAIPPPVDGGRRPAPAGKVTASADAGGVRVRWHLSPSERATSYAVYRVDGKAERCAPVPTDRLLVTTRGAGIVDPTAAAGKTYTYYVTALDRLHHESAPARGATVTAARG